MGERRKTAIYLRVSAEDSQGKAAYRGWKESPSISHQREYLLEYIRNDRRLAGSQILEFRDDGFTATNMERPGMQKMLESIRQNQIGCILVKDISRFSRNYIEAGTYLNQVFPFMGVDFIAVNDGYDSRDQKGLTIDFDTEFRTLVYALYSKDISIKVKTSFDTKCAAGEYVFGQVPLGYEKSREVKNRVVVNEREAKIVRRVFAMAVEGMTTTGIARKLFEEQVPTATELRYPDRNPVKGNRGWSSTMVRKILSNRFYLGEMAYGKSVGESVGSKKRIAVPKSDWKVMKNHHEPLVTPEVFALAAPTSPGHSTKRKRPKHPLTGKIYCGGCGYSLNYKPEKGNISGHFWCGRHSVLRIEDCCSCLKGDILEEMVLMLLNLELTGRGDLFRQREALEKFQRKRLAGVAKKERDYRKQYRDMEKERDYLYEQYAAGEMDAEGYRDRADQLTGQMEELSGRIVKAKAERCRIMKEAEGSKDDMEPVIRCSHLETLTGEAADVFIRIKGWRLNGIFRSEGRF